MRAIQNHVRYEVGLNGLMGKVIVPREVKIMVIIDKYAMARIGNGAPFVVSLKELQLSGIEIK